MSAYLIADVEVLDSAGYETYRQQVPATIAAFGGRYLVRGGALTVLEGAWSPKRCVILEFPSMAQLKAWYDSPSLRAAARDSRAQHEVEAGDGRGPVQGSTAQPARALGSLPTPASGCACSRPATRLRGQVGGGSDLDRPAALHHHQALAQVGDHRQVVADHQEASGRARARSASSRFSTSACTEASSAEVGSSSSSTCGSRISARAMATRWRWPPESWCG